VRRYETAWAWLFVAPAVLGFVLFAIGPIAASLVMSFTDWPIISAPSWVGAGNYLRLFLRDPLFWTSLKVTVVYAACSVPLGMAVAFGLAVLLNQRIRGLGLFRTVFYLPSIFPVVASSVLFLWFFNPEFGVLNAGLRFLHLPPSQWVYAPDTALPSLILMSLWSVGGTMIIFLAGLQNVPQHLYEAVDIDGGASRHKALHVTIPMITPVILFNLVLSLIHGLQAFTQAYVMTQGGPNNATLFYVFYLYRTAFADGQMGYAAAMAWILFVIIAALTALIFRSSSAWVYYEGER
jgi:multiple sugar transport system permease protein